jgi:hypothetical protein
MLGGVSFCLLSMVYVCCMFIMKKINVFRCAQIFANMMAGAVDNERLFSAAGVIYSNTRRHRYAFPILKSHVLAHCLSYMKVGESTLNLEDGGKWLE